MVLPDVIYVQETMVDGAKAREVFPNPSKDLDMCSMESIGQSIRLPSTWNPHVINASPFSIIR